MGELCEEQIKSFVDADFVRERKKQRKTGLEVRDVKEKLASAAAAAGVVLSNREIRLLRFAYVTTLPK